MIPPDARRPGAPSQTPVPDWESEKVATQLLVTDPRDATAMQTEPYDVMYVEFKATLHKQVRYRGTLQY